MSVLLTDAALVCSAKSSLEGLREGGVLGEDEAVLLIHALDNYNGAIMEAEATAALAAAANEVIEAKRSLVGELKEFKNQFGKELREIKLLLLQSINTHQVAVDPGKAASETGSPPEVPRCVRSEERLDSGQFNFRAESCNFAA
jgi:hypothetical protein